MNKVTVAFAPLKRYPKITIDGDSISPYSDLAGCENKDLHVCGTRLLELLDDEIGNEYQIELQGSQFQIDLMTALSEKSDYCAGVRGISVPLAFDIDEIIDFSKHLDNRYTFKADQDLRVHLSAEAMPYADPEQAVMDEHPDLYLAQDTSVTAERGKTVLIVSDHFDIRNQRGINYVKLPREAVSSFIQYFQLYTKKLPYLETVFSKSRYAALSKEELLLLEAYETQKPKYIFEIEKTGLDVGESSNLLFQVYPLSASGSYRLSLDNQTVAAISGGKLTALQEGTAVLSVMNAENKLCESKKISVYKHNFVEKITLVPSDTSIEVGRKGRIEALITPENAEDAKNLKWTSSDNDIVYVNSAGDFTALKPGTAVITVESRNCSEQVKITVCPSLESLSLSRGSLIVQAGGSAMIECGIVPKNAAHEELIWELSNDGMGTLNVGRDGTTCTFTASTSLLTKGVLTCRAKNSDKKTSCEIQIIPEDRPTGLITTAMIFSILGLIGSFLIPLFHFGGGGLVGFLVDFFLPVGMILCVIGKSKTNNKETIFGTMLKLDVIVTIVMILIAVIGCQPPN